MSGLPHATEIMFRGEEREINWTHKGDGVFEWWFPELEGPEHDALAITDAEDAAIRESLWEIFSEPEGPDDWRD